MISVRSSIIFLINFHKKINSLCRLFLEDRMAYETLVIEHEEPILIIRLNRPNALNALNSKLLEELKTHYQMRTIMIR